VTLSESNLYSKALGSPDDVNWSARTLIITKSN